MYDLERFVQAQSCSYEDALGEIRRGKKRTHWMWYVFPQICGLGHSETAKYYALRDLGEAEAYLAHPVLGERLQEICGAALRTGSDDAQAVFGYPDCLKFCSSMTLFEQADPANPIYGQLLEKFYRGQRDRETLRILREQENGHA